MHTVQQVLQAEGQLAAALADPHGGDAVQVSVLLSVLQVPVQSKQAPAQSTPRHEATGQAIAA